MCQCECGNQKEISAEAMKRGNTMSCGCMKQSHGEYIIEDNDLYFKWDEPNKYIVKGNKTIYFELNGIKL